MNLFLQIFLYADVFIIGAVCSIAFRHAYAHYHSHPDSKKEQPEHSRPKDPPLAKEIRERLLAESEIRYRRILDNSAEQLSKELSGTAEKINRTIEKIATDVSSREIDNLNQLFKQYQENAASQLSSSKEQTEAYENELKTKLQTELDKERQRLSELIDNKLSDIVMSFLTEAMQHEVDLGAQSDYLIKLLEQHKDEFKQALN